MKIFKFILNPAFIVIALGLSTGIAKDYVFFIPYALMSILFFAFIEIEDYSIFVFNKRILKLLFAMILIALFFYISIILVDKSLAYAAMLMALSPTALASPAITKKINKDVNVVAVNILFTNLIVGIIIPLFFFLLSDYNHISKYSYLEPIIESMKMILIPFFLAYASKKFLKKQKKILKKISSCNIVFWVLILLIASSAASFRIKEANISFSLMLSLFFVTLLVIVVNFIIGLSLDKSKRIEIAQSLFQKNTMFAVWFALKFLPPIISLAPIFYAVLQNLLLAVMITYYSDNRRKKVA